MAISLGKSSIKKNPFALSQHNKFFFYPSLGCPSAKRFCTTADKLHLPICQLPVCQYVGTLHNRQAKKHLLCPQKKKHTHTHTQQQKQSARGKRRKTKDSSAQLALNGKQSTAMAKTTMEARSLVFFLLMAFCWMLGMFARKVVWFVCLFFFFFFLAFGRRYQAAPAGKRNPPKKQKTNTAVITKMTAKLHYGTAVASDGHVRRSSSAGDINVGNEGV